MALRVLAHFLPGATVLDFVALEADRLDIRWCAENDDETFYAELPDADLARAAAAVGLIGYGNVAKRVEPVVAAMGASVLHTTTGPDGTAAWRWTTARGCATAGR